MIRARPDAQMVSFIDECVGHYHDLSSEVHSSATSPAFGFASARYGMVDALHRTQTPSSRTQIDFTRDHGTLGRAASTSAYEGIGYAPL